MMNFCKGIEFTIALFDFLQLRVFSDSGDIDVRAWIEAGTPMVFLRSRVGVS